MSKESVFDPATGKYGVWIDGEFVIDAKKRHEDDPNSIIKQEIKEEPGAADLCEIDGMDYETEFFDNREMMLPVFKIKSTEKVSVVNDGKEALANSNNLCNEKQNGNSGAQNENSNKKDDPVTSTNDDGMDSFYNDASKQDTVSSTNDTNDDNFDQFYDKFTHREDNYS